MSKDKAVSSQTRKRISARVFFFLAYCSSVILTYCFIRGAAVKQNPRTAFLESLLFPTTKSGPYRGVSAGASRCWLRGGEKILSLSIAMRRENSDRLPALATELVRLKVDVIVTSLPSQETRAAKEANEYDSHCYDQCRPIRLRNRASSPSLARPGDNITGLSTLSRELSGKRIGASEGNHSQTHSAWPSSGIRPAPATRIR